MIPLTTRVRDHRLEARAVEMDGYAYIVLDIFDTLAEEAHLLNGTRPPEARAAAFRRTVSLDAHMLRDLERYARQLQGMRSHEQASIVERRRRSEA